MKNNSKYPGASEEQIQNLKPAPKVLGLHPLIWAAIVVMLIAGGRACDKVEDLGCKFFEWYDVEEDNSDHSRTHAKGSNAHKNSESDDKKHHKKRHKTDDSKDGQGDHKKVIKP